MPVSLEDVIAYLSERRIAAVEAARWTPGRQLNTGFLSAGTKDCPAVVLRLDDGTVLKLAVGAVLDVTFPPE